MMATILYAFVLVLSAVLTAQAVFTLGLMLYTWARPERLEESDSPDVYLPPKLSFTAILPAKNGEGVIGDTLRRVWETDYPEELLLEVVVVCEESDRGTIEEAEGVAREIGHLSVRVVTFSGKTGPVNKPRGLNVAFPGDEERGCHHLRGRGRRSPRHLQRRQHDHAPEGRLNRADRGAADELRLELVLGAERTRVLLLVQVAPSLPREGRHDRAIQV